MSIKSELNKTADHLRRTRKAILGRGGEISETAGLKDLPEAIINIPADTSLAFQTDEETAYEKVVPSGAEEYALLKKVGGMSYKTRNLIPFPYVDSTKTVNGVTFTVNSDQTITANGTATANADFWIAKDTSNDNTVIGSFTMFSCCPSGGSRETYYVNGAATGHFDIGQGIGISNYPKRHMRYRIVIVAGYTANNLVFKPMLNLCADNTCQSLPYEPYFEGLRHTKVTAFESEGANLIPFPYYENSKEVFGITWQANEDGGVTVSGTSTGYSTFDLTNTLPKLTNGKSYIVSGKSSNVSIIFCYKDDSGATQWKESSFEWKSTYTFASFYLQISPNKTINETIYPMLNEGTTALPYKPYSAEPIDTYTIPEAVQSIEGYGLGVEGSPNSIDFLQRKYINASREIVLTGKETFEFYKYKNEAGVIIFNILDTQYLHATGICTDADVGSGTKPNTMWIGVGSSSIYWLGILDILGYTSVSEFTEYVANRYAEGNPIKIIYALAEPIETDISDILPEDNFLKVEGGGVIRAVNEYKQGAPSTIKYTVKVGS